MILSIHLGLHFKIIFAKLNNKIKDKKNIKRIIYMLEIVVVILGIRAMIDTNLGSYLIGKVSFAIPTSLFLSLLNNCKYN